MRHLGILAHSTEGAALCFLSFCQEGVRRLGSHVYPDVTLDYIAFGHSMPAWDSGDHDTIRKTLATSVERLARAGADYFVCPDNTAHIALERPGEDLALAGLRIAEIVADQAASAGYRRVGVIGTKYLMASDVYPNALAARGIAVDVPGDHDHAVVDRIIFDELVNGVFTDESRAEYVRVIDDLAARGCDAVALVCTEIPLLVSPEQSPLPTLDSTRLLARAALEVGVGDLSLPSWRGGPSAETSMTVATRTATPRTQVQDSAARDRRPFCVPRRSERSDHRERPEYWRRAPSTTQGRRSHAGPDCR